MNTKNILALATLVAVLFATGNDAFAQKKGKKKKAPTTATTEPVAPAPTAPVAVVDLYNPPNEDSLGYNQLSARPVHKSDIMYKMTVWRRIDFREKCNEPMFASGNQISKFIMMAVQNGTLIPYTTDSVNRKMTKEQFLEKIKDPTAGDVSATPAAGDEWGAAPATGAAAAPAAPSTPILFEPVQLYLFDMKEDLVFDKQRSRMYNDIQVFTMILDSKFSVKSLEEQIASFRYKDLIKAFNGMPGAKWYNFQNRAEDKKIGDAFDLRLFCSRITKISNPGNNTIDQIDAYSKNAKTVLITSQQFEYDIVEKENELWDF